MTETLEKLRPDRDLQCYFQQPSAAAALSGASATGFTVSGTWRQQFDWATIEWNRDNVYEHPVFRNLPDGDLSGLDLTYEETRTNCIPIDSDLFPTVEWPYLRIWRDGQVLPDLIPLRNYATPAGGSYQAASATLELQGGPTAGDYIGLAWLNEQYNYQLAAADTIETAAAALAAIINSFTNATAHATLSGAQITLTAKTAGANWNRVGVYGFVSGARTESWSPWSASFTGGVSPTSWQIHLNFASLQDKAGNPIDASAVRKMRWTYAAGWQDGGFQRSEFQVQVTNWTVSGTNLAYAVAGPGSRRIEDDAPELHYTGTWTAWKGPYNFSGGSISMANTDAAGVSCTYAASAEHQLYFGTRYADTGATIDIAVDGGAAKRMNLRIPLEDRLVRVPLGTFGAGTHTVSAQRVAEAGGDFYFEYIDVVIPALELPVAQAARQVSLATDWDTDHSLCLAPERTAWMIDSLGFHGRVNHYAGAMWFYELAPQGYQYASATVTFAGTPDFGGSSTLQFASTDAPSEQSEITHVHYIGDTAETVAKAFEMEVNRGLMSVRAQANGPVLTLVSRFMGLAGNSILVEGSTTSASFTVTASGPGFADGRDGEWRTDLQASPRLNRAARDWTRSFFAALAARGLNGVAALSMELRHGDRSVEAGIAQRCPAGDPVLVSTPALQTNFSPASRAFWKEAYLNLAAEMAAAGVRPYLQFGEVQWWYSKDDRSGMPYYDQYTQSAFQAAYGRPMQTIPDQNAAVSQYAQEAAFLPTLIAQFTDEVISYVRTSFPDCRFEVLYPLDVNEGELNRAVNYAPNWVSPTLDCLKTESFGYTHARNLDQCLSSIREPETRGFPLGAAAHLVGISDPTTPWQKEVRLARAEGLESVVLFALDQFCLVGYAVPLPVANRRSRYQG